MSSDVVYHFTNIRPGSTVNLFVHGYTNRQAVSFCAVVYPQLLSGVAGGGIILRQGEVYRHVDGTVGRMVYIDNPTSGWQDADVIETVENF
jgi:hypothetical protein